MRAQVGVMRKLHYSHWTLDKERFVNGICVTLIAPASLDQGNTPYHVGEGGYKLNMQCIRKALIYQNPKVAKSHSSTDAGSMHHYKPLLQILGPHQGEGGRKWTKRRLCNNSSNRIQHKKAQVQPVLGVWTLDLTL